MKALITGANGFLGMNLRQRLAERGDVEVFCYGRQNSTHDLKRLIHGIDVVFHLAGVNRPSDPGEFHTGNVVLTEALVEAAVAEAQVSGRNVPILYTSSTQAALANAYGNSKRAAEEVLQAFAMRTGAKTYLLRLPNVFGKWCRPNYNSAVATFCHNIARGQPVQVNDPAAPLVLVYVEDVVEHFVQWMDAANSSANGAALVPAPPQYTTTVGEVVRLIQTFRASRETLMTERVGGGFVRALYSTYVSYLPPESFAYPVPMHGDPRGVFVEMLKTPDCGQVSFFTAHPGITRGGHYHHTKTEKFLVIMGQARFKFRHVQTGDTHELLTSGEKAQVVETVPGWTHDITNVGTGEMVVMLWANEVFDPSRPDTYACPL
jgi:UDP-2-acetamido-2,6-beta-L-arabino-hexul-4-ose reductase